MVIGGVTDNVVGFIYLFTVEESACDKPVVIYLG
jgi:hypothetical protein